MEPQLDAPEQSEEEVTQNKASRVPPSSARNEDSELGDEDEAMEDEQQTEGGDRGDNEDPEDDAETEPQPEPSEGMCASSYSAACFFYSQLCYTADCVRVNQI